MRYQQLTEGLRYQIALLCEDKVSQAEIGRRLGVSQSTVSRELRRNRSVDGYLPAVAQKLSDNRRKAAGKRLMHEDTVFFVEEALNGLWRPEQISAIGNIIGRPVSHKWIYQHVATDKAFGGELYQSLRQGKRRYRKGYGKKRSSIPDAVSIEQRPAVVDERSRVGDWEADLVLGKRGTGAIVPLAERKSRIYLTKKVFSKDSTESGPPLPTTGPCSTGYFLRGQHPPEVGQNLGVEIGLFVALHTYGRQLNRHPHIHLSVTRGGLCLKHDVWRPIYFKKKVVEAYWRQAVIKLLRESYAELDLSAAGYKPIRDYREWCQFLEVQFPRRWKIHFAKKTKHARQNVNYLGRYLKRLPMAAPLCITIMTTARSGTEGSC